MMLRTEGEMVVRAKGEMALWEAPEALPIKRPILEPLERPIAPRAFPSIYSGFGDLIGAGFTVLFMTDCNTVEGILALRARFKNTDSLL
jgi:hypothetical protein